MEVMFFVAMGRCVIMVDCDDVGCLLGQPGV